MKRSNIILVVATILISIGSFIAVLLANYSPVLGLDLQGGASVVYKPAHTVSQATLQQTISIIRNRVDALGIASPNISQQGNNIVVQLPGVKDAARALQVVGQTAELAFRPVLCQVPAYTKPPKGYTPPASAKTLACPTTSANTSALAYVPSTPVTNAASGQNALLPINNTTSARYIVGPTVLTGSALKSAYAGVDSSGNWIVYFSLTPAGSPKFDAMATKYYQKQVAIVLDGIVESAPTINAKTFGGQGTITGSFTQTEAQNLGLVLKYGALPVQLQQQTVQTVSPSLGASSLKAGILAGLIGLAAVMIYTVLYYRLLGIVVLLGLGTTAALLWAIVSYLGHSSGLSLDLSGVTGLIVSVGVTVDSYIVFFERLKDEVRAGKTIRSSVDKGFKRAFRTIIAADSVSFIGALLLYLLSIGPVRGFAFFLGLSTLLDVITAFIFTRPLVIMLGQWSRVTGPGFWGMARGLGSTKQGVPAPVGATS
ncbi:MAG: protein translocase subunit SecD [Acidimicrobiaceae bacterium]|nr:protein translocase subunit SecD [Acidimicrobiaceae bacterium]